MIIVSVMDAGESFHFCCHSNLVRAVLPYGLTEFDVHDVLNVFVSILLHASCVRCLSTAGCDLKFLTKHIACAAMHGPESR